MVIVTEEALDKARHLVNESLPEVCVCLRHFFIASLNKYIVKLKRLCLCIAYPSTESTNIALKSREVSRDIILVSSHIVKKVCNLFKSCCVRALFTIQCSELCSNVIKVGRLLVHLDKCTGHYAEEAVFTVGVRRCTCKLKNIKVSFVDRGKRVLSTSYDVTHVSESYLELDAILNTRLKEERKLLGISVLVQEVESTGLPLVVKSKSEIGRLSKRSSVIVTLVAGVKSVAVYTQLS